MKHSAILSTFINLPIVIKIFVLSIFEWPFYIGFTVQTFFKKYCDYCLILKVETCALGALKTLLRRYS